jgi:putative transposase
VYLHVSRQREDHARKLAGTLIASCDAIAYEALQMRNMVKNHHLAKFISDASWARFLWWVEHYARLHGIMAIAVPPHWTTQDCSGVLPDGSPCSERVRKSLSVRTHVYPSCGLVLDRDHNAALNVCQAAETYLHRTAG